MTDQDHLDRINALTRNARQTWFALLAALVFVGITLMSVEHIDFYGVDRATQLPLVNVAVPTRYFFVAAPILIAAIYGYFHLYLIRLWDALGAAPARLGGLRLGDAIAPWLVTDAALHFRRRMRGDNATTPRTLEGGAMVLNFLLAWGFGLVILYLLWQQSMPARTFWMTAIAAACLAVSIITGVSSIAMLARRMRRAPDGEAPARWTGYGQFAGLLIGGTALLWSSFQQTEGPISQLALLDLVGEPLVERPAGWLSYQDARSEFRAEFCRREFISDTACRNLGPRQQVFEDEFDRRRSAALNDMRRPDWSLRAFEPTNMDFRRACMSNAFLSGANLRRAQVQGIDLRGAQMEGTNLRGVRMEGAILRGAKMESANLYRARMERTDFSGAHMEGVDLRGAQMKEANFRGAQMEGAMFDYSELTGTSDKINTLFATNLSRSANKGGLLRFVDLTEANFDAETDFRNAFLDGSVAMTETFRAQMGNPCQWATEIIDNGSDLYGRWRGWIEARSHTGVTESPSKGWTFIAPPGFENVTAIPPPPGCTWKTGPMPGADAQD
jgi:uncharacterized protein YjbI with pentapeptide repeats